MKHTLRKGQAQRKKSSDNNDDKEEKNPQIYYVTNALLSTYGMDDERNGQRKNELCDDHDDAEYAESVQWKSAQKCVLYIPAFCN